MKIAMKARMSFVARMVRARRIRKVVRCMFADNVLEWWVA
jgi:hypothetical protein